MVDGIGEPPRLIQALLRAQAYPHAAGGIRLVETHISWVLLTGAFAYKLKKPLRFSFLDFSTLEQRRQACLEELRLNRRLAPDLYLDVVPISGTADEPCVGGTGTPIEWAVKMREFPQEDQLDHRLAAGRLDAGELEDFGRRLAGFHASAPSATAETPFGEPERVHAPARENVDDLLAQARGEPERSRLAALRDWTETQFIRLRAALAQRKRDGFVREGHGDLHLANLVRWGGGIVAFDCIEFNPALRWVDGVSDVAFLVMDLIYRGHRDLAYRFLNAYQETSGDYAGVRVLRYYLVYRALVRAKIAMIRSAGAADRIADEQSVRAHLELAHSWTVDTRPALILMHGFSGSGKTRLSAAVTPLLPAVRLRSDVERKRLHGLEATQASGSGMASGIYSPAASERTYERLAQLAEAVLAGGETVVVDAAFLQRGQRQPFLALARRLGLPWMILDCQAPVEELRRRVEARSRHGRDASEADRVVLDHQLVSAEPLDIAECANTLGIDTSLPYAPPSIALTLRERLQSR